MDSHNLRIWGLIQAELVRVEAMKVANIERLADGKALAYSEQAFIDVYNEIDRLARSFE